MTHDEMLQMLYDETLVGNAPAVKEGVEDGLEDGLEPERMLYDALIPSLEEVGARFERGDYFVPEMLIAARAMQGALDILRPLLAETGAKPIGKFLMGTVKGDVHDIGKNLCNIMLEGAGFEVIDLGVNVPPEKFVEQINEHEPDVVGFSAFLTTTMPMFKANINALQKAGIRDKVIVMVGGAPVTQEYADAVGADGYSRRRLVGRQEGQAADRAARATWCRPDGHDPRTAGRRPSRSAPASRSASSASGSTRPAARSSPRSCAAATSARSRSTRTRRSRRAPTCSTSTPASRSSTRPSCWPRCCRRCRPRPTSRSASTRR